MAVASARSIVNLKDGHFSHEESRIEKYTLADELPSKLSELRLLPRPMSSSSRFTIRVLSAKDKESTLNFLRRFFFKDEPMNQAVKLLENPEGRCVELEEYSASSLDEEASVAAVDEKGDIVGIVLNGLVRKDDPKKEEEPCSNEKFSRILGVLSHLSEQARLWERLPGCAAVMEVRIASVHTGWRGKGLMRALCEESERIAVQHGACAMRMDATSAFSAAAAERLGYRNIYTVNYKDLPGAPHPDPPHLQARVYIKEL